MIPAPDGGFEFVSLRRCASVLISEPVLAKGKKTDVIQRPKAINHVGLLFNQPLGTNRGAIYLVVR